MSELELILSVKRRAFRNDTPFPDDQNAKYLAARKEALSRDNHTCQFCDLKSSMNETHHLNDDHNDNRVANLVTACTMCHMVNHIAYAGISGRASLIYLHEVDISHAGLNALVRAAWLAEHKGSGELKNTARLLYERLEKAELMAIKVIGTSSPIVLGNQMQSLSDADYEQRHKALSGIYLLPKKEAYKKHIQHWSKELSGPKPDHWIEIASEKFANWSLSE